ncbi:MAG: asparagine synthase (glutamine-hydrolyzing) [Nitrospirae bacterium]|nr:asparagine synthase (glutamine-hydrolyzing) [Nitrospirota bacterium]
MCGIVGFVSEILKANNNQSLLKEMCNSITHRGPDGEGLFFRKNVGLGMRRLSIIDLTTGQQPIFNEDGAIAVVFNGEIYNYHELRTALIEKGHRFSTESDTETIVHCYEEYGDKCPSYLRGMFAFAIWDDKNQRLILARDRMGIKPLYYSIFNKKLYFASEIKALLKVPEITQTISPEAVNAYFTFGYIPDPLTIFEEIKQLLPGNMLIWEKGKFNIQRYWELPLISLSQRSPKEWEDEILSKLDESVRLHMVSDVPVGIFLSGGIDSSAILALMAKHTTQQIKTFSIGFEGNSFYDERPFAKIVTDKYRTEHHEFIVRPDVKNILSNLIEAFDQPFADSSAIPTYYVSQMTSQYVKVALSGLGGDELFGGYERYIGNLWAETYKHIPAIVRNNLILPIVSALPDLSNGLPVLNRAKRFVKIAHLEGSSRYIEMISFFSQDERRKLFASDFLNLIEIERPENEAKALFKRIATQPLLSQTLLFDQQRYLTGDLLVLTDRISMAHSLEVRVPFLDHVFLESAMTIPPELKIRKSAKKYILKKAVSNLLPPKILHRGKRGFSVPLAEWIRGELREVVSDHLSNGSLKDIPYLNNMEVQRILTDHLACRYNYENQIWALLIFVLWYKRFTHF